jgi:hypothetical protein
MPPVRRLTAILAADVAGYSRLMGADEEGTHERSSPNTRVRCRTPSPRMRATASVVLSYRIERGTLPKNANAALCPSQNASAVSAG